MPVDARAVLSTVVDRGSPDNTHDETVSCLLADVALATGLSQNRVAELVAVLEAWDIAFLDVHSDERGLPLIVVRGIGWPLWPQLKAFASASDRSVREFAVDLRFDLLDVLPSGEG